MSCITRIGKVGGSLLDYDQLPAALRDWLDGHPGVSLLLAGGGVLADFVRDADRRFQLGEAASHALCLQAMRVSAEVLAKLLRDACVVRDPAACSRLIAAGHPATVVLDTAAILGNVEEQHSLPEQWSVTSDSIAAFLACRFGVGELVLFKSLDLPGEMTYGQAAAAGLVDPYFPTAAAGLPQVRWVNLRASPASEQALLAR